MRFNAALMEASLARNQETLLRIARELEEARFTVKEQAALSKVIRERSEVLAEFGRHAAGSAEVSA